MQVAIELGLEAEEFDGRVPTVELSGEASDQVRDLQRRITALTDFRDQRRGLLNRQLDRGIGEDWLIVAQQIGACETGLVEGDEGGG